MSSISRELNYLKEIAQLEPTTHFLSYLNLDESKKLEWLKNVKDLRERVASDILISPYKRDFFLKKVNSYLEKAYKSQPDKSFFNTNSQQKIKSNLFLMILVGLLSFGLGWYASDFYRRVQEERIKKIAELVFKRLD